MLFFLLTPPALTLLALGLIAYKQREKIISNAHAITLALAAVGFYRRAQKIKPKKHIM
ncbi:MAG: hypothetical protein ACRCXC_02705 [Legionella sp.]